MDLRLGRIPEVYIEPFKKSLEAAFNAGREEAPKKINPSGHWYERYVYENFAEYEKTLKEQDEPTPVQSR